MARTGRASCNPLQKVRCFSAPAILFTPLLCYFFGIFPQPPAHLTNLGAGVARLLSDDVWRRKAITTKGTKYHEGFVSECVPRGTSPALRWLVVKFRTHCGLGRLTCLSLRCLS